MDVRQTLGHIHSALQDGGFLCFYEETGPLMALLWGLEERSGKFTDERDYGPYLSVSRWMEVLKAAGLPPVIVHTCPYASSALFLCRKLPEARPRVTLQAPALDLGEREAQAWLEGCQKTLKDGAAAKQTLVVQGRQDISPGTLGFARCLAKEEGRDRIRCVFNATPGVEVRSNPAEGLDLFMVVYKDGVPGTLRTISILKRSEAEVLAPVERVAGGAHLHLPFTSDLNSLQWVENSPLRPAGHLQCAVSYAALNASDALLMQGKLPPDGLIRNLGSEFSGTTTKGQRLMGLASAAIGTHVLASPQHVWEVPAGWSLEEAASVPVAYTTAYYALLTCARIEVGQMVLVHGGCDPVGTAVIRIAIARGCVVMTSVRSEEEVEVVLQRFPQMKQDHVASVAGFEEMVLRNSDKHGVDIIFNVLAGDVLTASLRLVAPHGAKWCQMGGVCLQLPTVWAHRLLAPSQVVHQTEWAFPASRQGGREERAAGPGSPPQERFLLRH